MRATKTPAPRRAGTEDRFRYAEDLARWIVIQLDGDARALRNVLRKIEHMAKNSGA